MMQAAYPARLTRLQKKTTIVVNKAVLRGDSVESDDYVEPAFDEDVTPASMGVAMSAKRERKAQTKAKEQVDREYSSNAFETVLGSMEKHRSRKASPKPKTRPAIKQEDNEERKFLDGAEIVPTNLVKAENVVEAAVERGDATYEVSGSHKSKEPEDAAKISWKEKVIGEAVKIQSLKDHPRKKSI